ncbi:MAG TPA: hypothetical protein VGO55_13955 [Allosphingosinicella sp.]|jgi:hypothetical protein|nr:hypothetical protein [Allosphingosinicella sp.]
MDEGKRKQRRPKVSRFIESRRALYLETLRRTGNHRAAARAAGIDRSTAEQRRKRDAGFALACIAAEAEAAQRLAGARHMFDGVEDARFETVRRGRGGRWQIVATRAGKWSKAMEDDYFDVLRATGNHAAAARAVGVSESLIWQRRRAWPGFRARIEETLDEAELVLELRLSGHGTNVGVGPGGEAPGTVRGQSRDCPPGAEVPFDPEFALRFLRWREEKRRGSGRRGRVPPAPDIAEVTEKIIRKVEAIKRHRGRSGLNGNSL